jgi:outer membrane translocation and assembly module TamA
VISGPVFGRRLSSLSLESQQWLTGPSIIRAAVAAFVDFGRASPRLSSALGDPFQIDAGLGIRVHLPGTPGMLRIDYARGLRDGRNAVTFGNQVSIW